MRFPLFALALLALPLAACDSAGPGPDPEPQPLEAETIADIAADPAERDPETGQTNQTGRYTFVNLRTGQVVLDYASTDRADSLSTDWDVAFQSTNIIANTTPGSQGGIQVMTAAFDEVAEAPASGYAAAVPGGADGWYTYTGPTGTPPNAILPTPGRVLVLKTADGHYAKLRIVSYYRGNPTVGTETPTAPSRYYTVEYVLQPDGSRSFE